MITLHTFGPNFGLPDPSPFVTKAELLLKMSGQPYRTDTEGFGKAPKGKLPYIKDDGTPIADSTFIRWHLEKKYQIDFDRGLSAEQRAIAWAFEKMAEDHLYWALVHARWMDDANFAKGPMVFFRKIPAPVRPIMVVMIRRQVRKALHAHGMGRHSPGRDRRLGHARHRSRCRLSRAEAVFHGCRAHRCRRNHLRVRCRGRCARCSTPRSARTPNATTISSAMSAA